jgi:hypothetical protein
VTVTQFVKESLARIVIARMPKCQQLASSSLISFLLDLFLAIAWAWRQCKLKQQCLVALVPRSRYKVTLSSKALLGLQHTSEYKHAAACTGAIGQPSMLVLVGK